MIDALVGFIAVEILGFLALAVTSFPFDMVHEDYKVGFKFKRCLHYFLYCETKGTYLVEVGEA